MVFGHNYSQSQLQGKNLDLNSRLMDKQGWKNNNALVCLISPKINRIIHVYIVILGTKSGRIIENGISLIQLIFWFIS